MNNYRGGISALPKTNRGIPGIPKSYRKFLNRQLFEDISKDLFEDPEIFMNKRGSPTDPRDFIKKSLTDNKQLRFHQCYFNPISCF